MLHEENLFIVMYNRLWTVSETLHFYENEPRQWIKSKKLEVIVIVMGWVAGA
jgi:hypothetical protein